MGEARTNRSATSLPKRHVEPGRNGITLVQGVCISVWLEHAGEQDGERLVAYSQMLADEHPGGSSSLSWVLSSSALPGGRTRQDLAHAMHETKHLRGDSAVVLEGSGFWASAVRGALTSLAMAGGKRAGFRMFSALPAATAWIAEQHLERTSVSISADEIESAARQLRGLVEGGD